MEYTSIGDTVNFAARLEALNKSMDTSIIISEETWRVVKDVLATIALPPTPVKGKAGTPRLFAVDIDAISAEQLDALRALALSPEPDASPPEVPTSTADRAVH